MNINLPTKLILVTLCLISGCTNKELYNSTQIQSKHHCDKEVGSEREKCMQQRNTKSFEEYEKDRQEIINQ